jgi:mannose-1-phosphate guanylyltransferase
MRQPKRYGLILAGGRGTRFWPRSRAASAKQVLRFLSERSLIQETVDRLKPVIPPQRLWIITSEALRKEVVRQLPEVPAGQILAEPAPRNTAPCIGLGARILETIDPEAVFGVFPADHVILRPAAYRKLLPAAFAEAAKGNIAVIGIKPRWAETGYGYIEFPKGTEAGETPKVCEGGAFLLERGDVFLESACGDGGDAEVPAGDGGGAGGFAAGGVEAVRGGAAEDVSAVPEHQY